MTHSRTVSFSDEAAMNISKPRHRSESVNSYFESTTIQRYPVKMSFKNNSNLKPKCNLATLNWLIPKLDFAMWKANLDDALQSGQIHRSLLPPLQTVFESVARFRTLPLVLEDFASNPADISAIRWLLTTFGGLELWKEFAKMISRHIVIPVVDARKNGKIGEFTREVDWLYYYFGLLEEDAFFCELGGPLLEGQVRSSREHVSFRRGIEEDHIREIKVVLKRDIWEALNDVKGVRGEYSQEIFQATNSVIERLNVEHKLEVYQPPPREEIIRTVQVIKEGCSNLEKLLERRKWDQDIQYGSAPILALQLQQNTVRENTAVEVSHRMGWNRAEIAARIEADAVQSRANDNAKREVAATKDRAEKNAQREAAAAKERAVENTKRQARVLEVAADRVQQEQSAKKAAAKRVAEVYEEESREVARALARGDSKELERDLKDFQDDHRRRQRFIEERISVKNEALKEEQARTLKGLKDRLYYKEDDGEKEIQLRALQMKHEQQLKELKNEHTRDMNAFYDEQDKKSAAFFSKAVEYARRPSHTAEAEPRSHHSRRRTSSVSAMEREDHGHRSQRTDITTQEIGASLEAALGGPSSPRPRKESHERPREERNSQRRTAPEDSAPNPTAYQEVVGMGSKLKAAMYGFLPAEIDQAKRQQDNEKERNERRHSSSPRRSSSRRHSLEPRTGEGRHQSTRRSSMEPRTREDNRSSSRRHSIEPSSKSRREDRREHLEVPVRREGTRRASTDSSGGDERRERFEPPNYRGSTRRNSMESIWDDRRERLEVPTRRESTQRRPLEPIRMKVDKHERRASYSPRRTHSPEPNKEDSRREHGPTSPRRSPQPARAPSESPSNPERRPRGHSKRHSTSSIPRNYEIRTLQVPTPVRNQETKRLSVKLPPYIITHHILPPKASPQPTQREFYSRPPPGSISVSQHPTVIRNPPKSPKPRRLSPEEIIFAEANARIAARQPLPRTPGNRTPPTLDLETRIPATSHRDKARRPSEVRLAHKDEEWRQSRPGPHEPASPSTMPERGILKNAGEK